MAALQRSSVSFRRQGSSGKIWNSGELKRLEINDKQDDQSHSKVVKTGDAVCSRTVGRSFNGDGGGGSRTMVGEIYPASESPSPRVSACGFCAIFRQSNKNGTNCRSIAGLN